MTKLFIGNLPFSATEQSVRALFEHQVMLGDREVNPVPAPRRGQGLRPKARGMLGRWVPGALGPERRLVASRAS